MRQVAPLKPGPGAEAEAVEELADRVLALRGVFAHEGEGRREEGPFVVADRGCGASYPYPIWYDAPVPKCITGSRRSAMGRC